MLAGYCEFHDWAVHTVGTEVCGGVCLGTRRGQSPDRRSALLALAELSSWAPDRIWRLIEFDSTLEETDAHK